jgi:hypothetical protein
MTTKEIREQLLDHENAIQHLQKRYLTQHGWSYTCSTPGALWMWEKKLEDGRVMLLSASSALDLQMEESADQELDECESY